MKLDRYKLHSVEVQTDKLTISEKNRDRLMTSLRLTLKEGDGVMMLQELETGDISYFSRHLMDPETGLSYGEPAPHNFSFNSPNGSCPRCKGLGEIRVIDLESIAPDKSKSIYQGGILPLGKYRRQLVFAQIEALCAKYEVSIKDPIKSLPEDLIKEILEGSEEDITLTDERFPDLRGIPLSYDGLGAYLMSSQDQEEDSEQSQRWLLQFTKPQVCPECSGWRLNKEALHYLIAGSSRSSTSSVPSSRSSPPRYSRRYAPASPSS